MKSLILFLLLLVTLPVMAQFNAGKYWTCGFIKAIDPEGGEVVYTITAGNTGSYFIITPCSGIVKVDTAAYTSFVNYKTWNLTFTIKDPEGKYIKTTGVIKLWKDAGVKRKPTVVGL